MSNKEFQVRHGLIVNGSINVSSQVFMGSMNLAHEMVMMNTYTQTVASQGSNTSGVVFDHSNNVYAAVNSAFAVINAAYTSSNADFTLTNAVFTQSNTDNVRLTSAYTYTNLSYSVANAAFGVANSAFAKANATSSDLANTAIAANNYAGSMANSGNVFTGLVYTAVNSAFGVINAAYTSSNADYVMSNAAFAVANGAFNAANTKLASAGGTITGDLVVQGNATFSGVTTYANTQTLLIGDNLVTLNADIPNNVAPSENSGLEINRGSSANVAVLWNEGIDRWTFSNDGTSYLQIASNVDVSTVDSRLTSAYGVTNAAFGQSNTEITRLSAAYVVANAAFGRANTSVVSDQYGSFISTFTSDINANINRTSGAYGSYAGGATNTPTNSGILYNFTSGTTGSGDGGQFWVDYVTNDLYSRKRWGGSWSSWQTYLSASNFNSYAPSLTQFGSVFGVANAVFTVANAAFGAANAEFTFSNTIYAAVNSVFGVVNAAYTSANADYIMSNAAFTVANAAFGAANSRVSSVSGTSGRITSSGGTTPAIDLATAGAGAASYSSGISALTVDAYGRVTAVTGSAGYATTGQLASYLPLSGGTLTGRVIQSASGFGVGTDDTINARIDSGFWQTSNAQTANGWPESTATWYHLITSTHSNDANYYSMQFAGSFFDSNALYYRATNNSGTTAWNKLWHAGNDGAGSGLDADTVDGIQASSFYLASNPSGYVTSSGVTSVAAGTGLSGGTITSTGTISMPNVGPGAGSYSSGISAITLDAQGRVTAITGSASYATTTQLASYLPLSGGTMSGALNISTGTSQPLTLTTSSSGPWALSLVRSDVGSTIQVFNNNGHWYFGQFVLALGSMRSPIFYDSDNTGYYIDPNSTTSLRTVGAWHADASSWTGEVSGKIQYHSSNWYFQAAGLWIFRNSGGSNVFTVNQSGHVSAPIFYDGNNSAFYCDPNSMSNFVRLRVQTPGTSWIGGHRGDAGIVSGTLGTAGSYHGWFSQRTPAGGYSLGTLNNNFYLTWGTNANIDGNVNSVSFILTIDSAGNATALGNVTAYSDIRLKENIETISNAISKIKQIRGVTFTRNDQEDKTTRHAGVIAQEVEKVLPEVVFENEQGIKTVAYGNMVGLLIEAFKEQQDKIDKLESLVNQLLNT